MKFIGANYSESRCEFSVWAPEKESISLLVVHTGEKIEMEKDEAGYFYVTLENVPADLQYKFVLENSDEAYPDPASQFQPEGVHGPSQVVDHQAYAWENTSWTGIPLKELIFYELHVGTFTTEGTFEAIIPKLDGLADVGINAIELMPVCQFPGTRNWGYDGVFPYAVQNSYGGPEQLKKLVDAAHGKGIAVFLDVIFNHIGPEGNYFPIFGPYFTATYCTPWGNAINLDGAWSDGVRDYFANTIFHWYGNYHIDGLRVDAVHMMFDSGAVHFWELVNSRLNQYRQQLGRDFYLIAECDNNTPRVVKAPEYGGWGFDGQWLDDFHHALYVLLDPAGADRYEDFGQMEQLAKAYTDGFVHSGEYVKFRKRKHGSSSVGLPGEKFVIFNSNHDQVGNRVHGERLSMLVDFERQKIAAAAILLAPYLPLLFMGEEFAADSPFFYFVGHSDENLIRMVVEGRRKEFENYKWDADPPNPQDEATFERSRLDWSKRNEGSHQIMLNWNKALIALRRSNPALQNFNKNDVRVTLFGERGFVLHRRSDDENHELLCIFNLGEEVLSWLLPAKKQRWNKVIDSKKKVWMENGEGFDFADIMNGGDLLQVSGVSLVVYEGEV